MPLIASRAGGSAGGFGGLGASVSSVVAGAFDSIMSYVAPSDIGSIITLSAIPQTYKDLVVIMSMGATYGGSGGGSGGKFYFNSDTSVQCKFAVFSGNGNGTIVGGNGNQNWLDFSALWAGNTNAYGQQVFYIYNYSSATKHKTITYSQGAPLLLTGNGTNTSTAFFNASWNSTTPISSINLLHGSGYGDGNLRQGSRVSVFGIKG